jgi:Fe-S-cluster containining protein
MNVTISSVEAERLAQFSKKRLTRVDRHIKHDPTHFAGVACPFLVENACSVYEIRPYACRAHVSFDTTAYWCEPERAYEEGMGMVSFDGAKSAYLAVLAKVPDSRFADIRDFFPG